MSNGDDVVDNWEEIDEAKVGFDLKKLTFINQKYVT